MIINKVVSQSPTAKLLCTLMKELFLCLCHSQIMVHSVPNGSCVDAEPTMSYSTNEPQNLCALQSGMWRITCDISCLCLRRPYSRAFSIDGESELLLESPHERADSEDDEVSSSSSAVRAWQHTLATQPGVGVLQTPPARRSLRSSLTTGLRHRAVTAAAAAAAAAAGEVGAGSVGIMREQVGDGLTLQPIGGAPVSSFSLAAAGITPGNVQEGVPTGGMLAAALAGNGGLAAATEPGGLRFSSSQDSILAAAAARAALSRSYHLPAGSFKSSQDAAAAAAAAVAAVNIAVRGTRQSCDSFTTAPAAAVAGGSEVFLRPGQQAPGAWVSAGGALVAAAAEQQLRGPQLQQGGQGSGSCSGAALVTEAAGLLMLPQGRSL